MALSNFSINISIRTGIDIASAMDHTMQVSMKSLLIPSLLHNYLPDNPRPKIFEDWHRVFKSLLKHFHLCLGSQSHWNDSSVVTAD